MAPRKKKGEFIMDVFMKFEGVTLEDADKLNEFIKDGFSRDSSAGLKPVFVNIDLHGEMGHEETKKSE